LERFLNALKAQAGALDRAQGQARFGLVASVDPARYAARVALQPEGVVTGWLPVLSAWVGPGWGVVAPPVPGQQVLVIAQEGDADNGVILGASFSDAARPPVAPAGEMWLVHASGAAIRLCNDGTVRIKGDLVVDGDVSDRAGSLARLRAHYDGHVHPPSGSTTSLPD
jgi:phage baseplate assembly protein V